MAKKETDNGILGGLLDLIQELASLAKFVDKALDDGRIDTTELAEGLKRISTLMDDAADFLAGKEKKSKAKP